MSSDPKTREVQTGRREAAAKKQGCGEAVWDVYFVHSRQGANTDSVVGTVPMDIVPGLVRPAYVPGCYLGPVLIVSLHVNTGKYSMSRQGATYFLPMTMALTQNLPGLAMDIQVSRSDVRTVRWPLQTGPLGEGYGHAQGTDLGHLRSRCLMVFQCTGPRHGSKKKPIH